MDTPAWILWYMIVTFHANGNESFIPKTQPMPSFKVCVATARKLYELEVPGRLKFKNVMCVDKNTLEKN